MYSLLVGADVSKEFFSVSGLSAEGKKCFSGTYAMKSHGFSEFLEALVSHEERPDQMLVAMVYRVLSHQSILIFEFPGNPYDRGESSVDFQFCEAFPTENEDG